MIVAKAMKTKIILTGKIRVLDKENGIVGFGIPRTEGSSLDKNAEYLVTVEGPINSKRTKNDRIVLSI